MPLCDLSCPPSLGCLSPPRSGPKRAPASPVTLVGRLVGRSARVGKWALGQSIGPVIEEAREILMTVRDETAKVDDVIEAIRRVVEILEFLKARRASAPRRSSRARAVPSAREIPRRRNPPAVPSERAVPSASKRAKPVLRASEIPRASET